MLTDNTRISRPEPKIIQSSTKASKSFKGVKTSRSIMNWERNK